MSIYDQELKNLISGPIDMVIEYLRRKRILKSFMFCHYCNNIMKEVRATRINDQSVFKCCNKMCSKFETTRSIRDDSVLSNFNIGLDKVLLLLFCWFENLLVKNTVSFSGCSRHTVIKFYDMIRTKICLFMNNNQLKLGGEGVVVQIDESMFRHKPKYHRGRSTGEEIWVFGLVDTSYRPGKGFMCIVPNRTQATFLPIIQRVCLPGSIIWSDQWRGYMNLSTFIDLDHFTVNHRQGFVNRANGVNTQTVESYWNRQKSRIKAMKGIRKDKLETYLQEFMFRDNFLDENFEKLLELLRIN